MSTPADTSQPAAAPAAETVSGDALASSLIGDVSAVPAPKPAAETAPAAAAAAPAGSVPADSLGRPFDPKKYRTKPDGSPFLNARGHFMPRGGRKPGRATPAGTVAPETARPVHLPPLPEAPKPAETATPPKPDAVPPVPAAPAVSRTAMEQTAEAYLRTGYAAADALFQSGREWQPDDAAEHGSLKEPLVEHLTISGAQPLPSWARVAVAIIAFAAKRFGRPATARTVGAWWSKVNGAKPVRPAEPPRAAAPQPAPERPASVIEIEPLR